MSYGTPDDSDPYRRRPPRRPATPPAVTPAATTPAPYDPFAGMDPDTRRAWVEFTTFADEACADLIGRCHQYTHAILGGESHWLLADPVLTAAALVARIWDGGRFGQVIDPAHILAVSMTHELFRRVGQVTSAAFGGVVLAAVEHHRGAGERGEVLAAAERFGRASLVAMGVGKLYGLEG